MTFPIFFIVSLSVINTLLSRQIGRHFSDFLKSILLYEMFYSFKYFQISLKESNKNTPSLFWILSWHWYPTSHSLKNDSPVCRSTYASLGLDKYNSHDVVQDALSLLVICGGQQVHLGKQASLLHEYCHSNMRYPFAHSVSVNVNPCNNTVII